MSGRVGDLSPKQATVLAQFKTTVEDISKPHYDDNFYLRWLRARKFDLKKSEKMLRESIEWREKNGVDTILETWQPPEILTKYYPGGLAGFDKQHSPIWIDTPGTIDMKGIFYSATKTDIMRYKIYWMEKIYKLMAEESVKLGRKLEQVTLIFDMEGIGTKHLWKPAVDMVTATLEMAHLNYPESLKICIIINGLDVFLSILSMFECRYPETLCYCYIINAPYIFPIAYNICKPFLSEDTKSKINVLGKDWKPFLLERIDADQLPKHWGGTMVGPNGNQYCNICMGGEVSKEYYMKKANLIDTRNFTSLTVGRGAVEQIEYEISKKGWIISWQFETDGDDIAYGVFRKKSAVKPPTDKKKSGSPSLADLVELVPLARVNSHMIPENGSFTCDTAGTYVMRFDNSYSWMKAKRVSYLVEILKPDDLSELRKSPSFTSEELPENSNDNSINLRL